MSHPIKHTAGGEMPDPAIESEPHFSESDFGDIGEKKTETRARSRVPLTLLALGIGAGLFYLFRSLRKQASVTPDEGRRAMEVDDVPPSRLMGA